jgi:hypothetical protein
VHRVVTAALKVERIAPGDRLRGLFGGGPQHEQTAHVPHRRRRTRSERLDIHRAGEQQGTAGMLRVSPRIVLRQQVRSLGRGGIAPTGEGFGEDHEGVVVLQRRACRRGGDAHGDLLGC